MILIPPKQTNRFRIEFLSHGTPIKELAIHALTVDPIRYNPSLQQHPVTVVFEDDIYNQVLKCLSVLWMETVDINLEIMDGDDNPMIRWLFGDGKMTSMTHGPFDYSLSAAILLQSEFICRTAKLVHLR